MQFRGRPSGRPPDSRLTNTRYKCIYRFEAAFITLPTMGPGQQLLFLADGRLFVRRDDGTVGEADPIERAYAHFVLTLIETAYWHSDDGLVELTPLADS